MRSILIPIALCSILGAALAQETRVSVSLKETVSAEVQPRLLFPQIRGELASRMSRGWEGPAYLGPTARFLALELGGRKVHLAFDKPGGALALGRAWCGNKGPWSGKARDLGADGIVIDFEGIESAAGPLVARLHYRPGFPEPAVRVEAATHRRGRAVIAGEIREVILVDGDFDGKFDGAKDRWLTLRPERAAKARMLRRAETQLILEPQIPFDQQGRGFFVEKVDAAGRSLTLVLGTPRLTLEQVLARRYAEVRREHYEDFAEESLAFAKRFGLDLSRPRVKEAAAWEDSLLSEAKKAAAAAGKPLLVFYFNESNPWCYRCDFYTLPDREVDGLLRKFHLARIDAEKDPEHSFQEAMRGTLPCFVPFRTKGESVTFTMRLRDEDGTTKDLQKPENAITGWHRPQEFAENLRRVLAETGKGN